MQITILGATGQVGKATLQEAIRQGYDIKVLVRSPEKLGDLQQKVAVIKGDLLDSASVDKALEGSSVVVNAAGGIKEPDQFEKFQKIATILSEKMDAHNISRLVNISGAVMALPGEKLNFQRRIMKVFVSLAFKQMKQAQEALLPIIIANKNIDWTFVRAAMIGTKPGTGNIAAHDTEMQGTTIQLEDLAKFMVEQIKSTKWIRKAPFLASK